MVLLVCDVLRALDYDWQFMKKDMRLKCRNVITHELIEDESMIDEFLKKNFIKFCVAIFRIKNNEEKYFLDVYLLKGTPIVFMNFAHSFLAEMKERANAAPSKLIS